MKIYQLFISRRLIVAPATTDALQVVAFSRLRRISLECYMGRQKEQLKIKFVRAIAHS
jgi:hypothetical protein